MHLTPIDEPNGEERCIFEMHLILTDNFPTASEMPGRKPTSTANDHHSHCRDMCDRYLGFGNHDERAHVKSGA